MRKARKKPQKDAGPNQIQQTVKQAGVAEPPSGDLGTATSEPQNTAAGAPGDTALLLRGAGAAEGADGGAGTRQSKEGRQPGLQQAGPPQLANGRLRRGDAAAGTGSEEGTRTVKQPRRAADLGACRPLPRELWSRVFLHLAASLESAGGGLRGPGVVAVDVVRAGLACRDMLQASEAGLRALAAAVPIHLGAAAAAAAPPPPAEAATVASASADGAAAATSAGVPGAAAGEPDWALVDGLLTRPPAECPEAQLRAALRQLGQAVPSSGGKGELVSQLRTTLGLAAASAAAAAGRVIAMPPPPARLCAALRQEREARCDVPAAAGAAAALSVRLVSALRDMLEAGDAMAGAALAQPSLAAMRRDLCALYGSTEGLLAAHRACLPSLAELQRRREEGRRRAVEAWRREEADKAAARVDELSARAAEKRAELERRAVAVHSELDERTASFRAHGLASCVCGKLAARACALLLCSECCRAYDSSLACPRHGGGGGASGGLA